jgi:hypothetical protein
MTNRFVRGFLDAFSLHSACAEAMGFACGIFLIWLIWAGLIVLIGLYICRGDTHGQ